MITREQWDQLTPERQFAYMELLELTIQAYMRQVGETTSSIHGFPELGTPFVMNDGTSTHDA